MKLLAFVALIALFSITLASQEQEKTILCQPCQLGVQLIKDFANKPDEELLAMLLKQCDRLPEQARGPCKLALSLVGRQIITYVRRNLQEPNKQICHRFRLCKSPTKKIVQDTPLCAPCQLGVNLVKDYLSKPDEELLKMLMQGCNALPEQLQAPCKMAITLVGGQMIAYIRTHLRESPRQICARFRLCGSQDNIVVIAQDTPLCTPCQLAVNLVKDYLGQPDENILRILLNGCGQLPENLQAPCKMAVTLVGSQMIAYIRSHVREEPRVICAKFRLCAGSFVDDNQDTPLCGPCQLGVNLVKDYISKPDEELLKMLLQGCNALPEQLQAPCKMAITLVGGQMIAFIRNNLRESPREICARFRLCGRQVEEKNPVRCVMKCLGSGWTIEKVLTLVAKCKRDIKCYAKEVGEDRAACILGCFTA